jgi:hypothetical protein
VFGLPQAAAQRGVPIVSFAVLWLLVAAAHERGLSMPRNASAPPAGIHYCVGPNTEVNPGPLWNRSEAAGGGCI